LKNVSSRDTPEDYKWHPRAYGVAPQLGTTGLVRRVFIQVWNQWFKAVVFNLRLRLAEGSWTILGGVTSRLICTQLYYICFIRVLDGVVGL